MKQELTEFNEGGSHEENPNGGIVQGMNPNGAPNTVEEGETKIKINGVQYIFSNKLNIREGHVDDFYLPGYTSKKSFADASKAIELRFKDRTDNASNSTKEALMRRLSKSQEMARLEKEASEMDMTVENLVALKQQEAAQAAAQEAEAAAATQMVEGQQPGQEPGQEQPAEQAPEGMAPEGMAPTEGQFRYGGSLYGTENAKVDGGANVTKTPEQLAAQSKMIAGVGGAATGAMGLFSMAQSNMNATEKVSVAGAAAKGALGGAAAGAGLGPIGAAVGAGVGGIIGGVTASTGNEKVLNAQMDGLVSDGAAEKLVTNQKAYGGDNPIIENPSTPGHFARLGLGFENELDSYYAAEGARINRAPGYSVGMGPTPSFGQIDTSYSPGGKVDPAQFSPSRKTLGFEGGFGGSGYSGGGSGGGWDLAGPEASRTKELDWIPRDWSENRIAPPRPGDITPPQVPPVNPGPDADPNEMPSFTPTPSPGFEETVGELDRLKAANPQATNSGDTEGEGDNTNSKWLGIAGLAMNAAPFIGNILDNSRLQRPELNNIARVGRTYIPEFADERKIQNVVNDSFGGLDDSIASSVDGNIGAYRANRLGASINKSKMQSSGFAQIEDINRGERKNLNADFATASRENVAAYNEEQDLNKQDTAAYDAAKQAHRVAAYEGLNKMGETLFKVNQMGGLSGYDWLTGNKKPQTESEKAEALQQFKTKNGIT
jgi:hypothetical protein